MTATERVFDDTQRSGPQRRPNAQRRQRGLRANVGEADRWLGLIGGGALAGYGLLRPQRFSVALTALGSYLVLRGLSGYCAIYRLLGVNTKSQEQAGIEVEQSVTINQSPEELYQFWRNFENLPRFMDHLQSVTIINDTRSHWVAKAPAGTTVEWDAEITQDRANELIAWRSLPNADVDNRGEVRFQKAPGDRGTEVQVRISYNPPAGAVGAVVAALFGEEPNQQVADDLDRFKQLIETGEIATTEGQPHGTRSPIGKIFSPNS